MEKFISKRRQITGGLLQKGLHLVTITEVSKKNARSIKDAYEDETPQIEVKFKNDKGVINHWFNLKGYMSLADLEEAGQEVPEGYDIRSSGNGKSENYLVNIATGHRLENPDKTDKAVEIFLNFANDAGIPVDEEFAPADLIGLTVGISVENKAGSESVRIKFFCNERRYEELLEKANA